METLMGDMNEDYNDDDEPPHAYHYDDGEDEFCELWQNLPEHEDTNWENYQRD